MESGSFIINRLDLSISAKTLPEQD